MRYKQLTAFSMFTADHVQQLVIPKFHGEKLTDIPDDHLSELLVWGGPTLRPTQQNK